MNAIYFSFSMSLHACYTVLGPADLGSVSRLGPMSWRLELEYKQTNSYSADTVTDGADSTLIHQFVSTEIYVLSRVHK